MINISTVAITGEGNGDPLQYPCLQNPMDGGPWQATVRGVTKSWTRLSDFNFHGNHGNGKESACNAGDPSSFPELGRSLGEGNGNPL